MSSTRHGRQHGLWLFGLACALLLGCGDGNIGAGGTDIDGPELGPQGWSSNGWSSNGWSSNGWSSNGWSSNGWSSNGFTGNQFTENAILGNPTNLDFIVNHPLTKETVNNDFNINQALTNPDTRSFFMYLYNCAAPAGSSIDYINLTDPHDTGRFDGGLGLAESSRWATDAVGGTCDDTCNRLVTACLASRANKYGIHVPMSLRGESDYLVRMAPEIPGYGYIKGTDDPVASTEDCASPTAGLGRNCGWKPAYVGWCGGGGTLTISAGCGAGSSTGNTMLRVCSGVHNCDTGTSVLGANDNSCGLAPKVTITCPAAGTYFNVMWAPYWSHDAASVADPRIAPPAAPTTAVYTSPEGPTTAQKSVFWVREGAFYGRALGSKYMHPGRAACPYSVIGGKLVSQCQPNLDPGESRLPGVYSCTAPGWSNALAYWQDRQCSGGTCWSNYTGVCNAVCSTGNYSTDPTTGLGLYDYNHCMGGGKSHDFAVTDFVPDRSEQCPPATFANACAGTGDGIGGKSNW